MCLTTFPFCTRPLNQIYLTNGNKSCQLYGIYEGCIRKLCSYVFTTPTDKKLLGWYLASKKVFNIIPHFHWFAVKKAFKFHKKIQKSQKNLRKSYTVNYKQWRDRCTHHITYWVMYYACWEMCLLLPERQHETMR